MNPFTGLYGAGTTLRNALFDHGVLAARRLQKAVVSVGNLSVGGSGKTPFVIALGELLKDRNIPFDVLSRGYGRKTRGVRIVEADGTADQFGDEPLLIARRLDVPVLVGESRYHAGCIAEEKFHSQLHILDDGFQHRSLYRNFDIVLVAERDFKDRLLPLGRLRETLSSLARADAVVLPQELAEDHPAFEGKIIWKAERELVFPKVPPSPVAFCGVARPDQFFAQLRAAGVSPAAEVVFRDHHAYDRNDIQTLVHKRRDLGAGGFVTTEKDAVNLAGNRRYLEPLAVAGLKLIISDPANLVNTILTRIEEQRPHS